MSQVHSRGGSRCTTPSSSVGRATASSSSTRGSRGAICGWPRVRAALRSPTSGARTARRSTVSRSPPKPNCSRATRSRLGASSCGSSRCRSRRANRRVPPRHRPPPGRRRRNRRCGRRSRSSQASAPAQPRSVTAPAAPVSISPSRWATARRALAIDSRAWVPNRRASSRASA